MKKFLSFLGIGSFFAIIGLVILGYLIVSVFFLRYFLASLSD